MASLLAIADDGASRGSATFRADSFLTRRTERSVDE